MKQSFNFEPTDTILQIKQTLQEKEGIDVPMIRLIYAGKSLADEQNIAHYNMKAGDTIHMLLQLKGGNWDINKKCYTHPLSILFFFILFCNDKAPNIAWLNITYLFSFCPHEYIFFAFSAF